jgi:CDP-diacylglycerol--serine O-phosphatidyltransferase
MVWENSEMPHEQRRKRFRRLRFRLEKRHLYKGLGILPNIFTLGNAFFGFSSMIAATHHNFIAAAYFVLIGALFDALDGRVARLVGVSSPLGVQLDSLSDVITFGLAPAFLVYIWRLEQVGPLGLAACALFMMAGILRLARFNITHTQQTTYFTGMPITAAGCFLSILVLQFHQAFLQQVWLGLLLVIIITVAGLMVSKIPFPTFKKLPYNVGPYIVFLLGASVIAFGFVTCMFILFGFYFLSALFLSLKRFFKRSDS